MNTEAVLRVAASETGVDGTWEVMSILRVLNITPGTSTMTSDRPRVRWDSERHMLIPIPSEKCEADTPDMPEAT